MTQQIERFESNVLSLKEYDLFTEFGIYLNKNFGFKTFCEYYNNSNSFKLKLDDLLNNYYYYIRKGEIDKCNNL